MTLQILDSNWLSATGSAAPSLRAIAASDENAFAQGDLVRETGETLNGVPVVSSALVQTAPDGTSYRPVGGRRTGANTALLIIVAVAPVMPSVAGTSPVLATGPKGASGLVWVIPANGREFLITGDASTPARAELAGPGSAPLNLFPQNVNDGELFARLRYGAPVGGASGVTLDGASFTDAKLTTSNAPGGHGELHVLGLTHGQQLGPRAQYRVRFRDID